MKLKSFNYLLLINYIFIFTPLKSEEEIDIWKKKYKKQSTEIKKKLIRRNPKLNLDLLKQLN